MHSPVLWIELVVGYIALLLALSWLFGKPKGH